MRSAFHLRSILLPFLMTACACAAGATISATMEGDDRVRIVCPGVFETLVTKRTGFGVEWYDLRRDPYKTHNLAPWGSSGGAGTGFMWPKIGRPGMDGSWMSAPGDSVRILEDGPLRVRVQFTGSHHRYAYDTDEAAWKDLGFDQIFTFYPDKGVYIAYTLIAAKTVVLSAFDLLLTTTGNWGPTSMLEGKNEVHVDSENGPAKPEPGTPTSFLLQWSDGPTYFTDVLLVARNAKYRSSYWNEGFPNQDFRTGFRMDAMWGDVVTKAPCKLNFYIQFGDDINSGAEAQHYARAYREPNMVSVGKGKLDTKDPGDSDHDGFNEDEGCYVLTSTKDGVYIGINAEKIFRPNPVFKIKQWPGSIPESIFVGGRRQKINLGAEYDCSLKDQVLLVQVHGMLQGQALLSIKPPRAAK